MSKAVKQPPSSMSPVPTIPGNGDAELDMRKTVLETVKCVLIGDTGVGKTRLARSRACGTEYSLPQLVQTHVPTIWAIDQYRTASEVSFLQDC